MMPIILSVLNSILSERYSISNVLITDVHELLIKMYEYIFEVH